ncbi:MAG: hypothetical protein M0006_15735 [Magnetospirillum sp.]|nr:hypothetical protein [Magnetospirillum sp.]
MTTMTTRLAAEIATVGVTRRLLTAALIERGFAADDHEARAAVTRIQALRTERRERRPRVDPLVSAGNFREFKLKRMREARQRQAGIAALLALPIAATWRSDRRAEIAAAYDPGYARSLAISATLEAITRLASTKWGFTRRHTSKSSGKADSRYLVLPGVGEVRLSDHEIPVYGERAWRYEQNGGPRWSEIVIGRNELAWTPIRWRRELILRAAGRR